MLHVEKAFQARKDRVFSRSDKKTRTGIAPVALRYFAYCSAPRCFAYCSAALVICLFLAATTVQAARHQSPLPPDISGQSLGAPVKDADLAGQSAQKQSAPKQGADQPKQNEADQAAPAPRKSAGQADLKGFCANPFGLEHKKEGRSQRKPDKSRHIYGKKEENVKPRTEDQENRLSFEGQGREDGHDRLQPSRRVFPGGENTLSRMDEDKAPEMRLNYKINRNATTSLVLNPQDEASPLPRPPEPEGAVNAAGLYMKVDVAPDVKLRLGGEYCDIDDPRAKGSDSSRGAAVGLEWSF